MNSEKHKQLIQKMKFHAFTNPVENTDKTYAIQPSIASGIVYPNDFVFIALTFEKLKLYDCLHFSVPFHEAKKINRQKSLLLFQIANYLHGQIWFIVILMMIACNYYTKQNPL